MSRELTWPTSDSASVQYRFDDGTGVVQSIRPTDRGHCIGLRGRCVASEMGTSVVAPVREFAFVLRLSL